MKKICFAVIVAFIILISGSTSTYAEEYIDGGLFLNDTAPLLTDTISYIKTYEGINGTDPMYFRFIPSKSEYYTIETTGTIDTEGQLYNSDGSENGISVDGGGLGDNFKIYTQLEAGNLYYIRVINYTYIPGDQTILRIEGYDGGFLLGPPQLTITNATTNLNYKAGQTITVSGTVNNAGGNNVSISAIIGEKEATTSVAVGNGAWILTWDIDVLSVPEGAYQNVTFSATNGIMTGTAIHTGDIVVDKTPPPAPSALDLTAGSDSGVSNTDNKTNDTTPTISGLAEANSTVSLCSGASIIATGTAISGTWNITTPILTAGTYNFTATATDAAGNTSVVSDQLGITIDTQAPGVSTVDVPSSNTYKAGDTLSFTVRFNDSVNIIGTDSTLALNIGGVPKSATYQSKTTNSVKYGYTIQSSDLDADGISVNSLNLNTSTIQDDAGNNAVLSLGSVDSSGVKVDGVAPGVPTISLDSGSDTGISNTDNNTNDTTPTIKGTAEANSTVNLYNSSTLLGSTTATGGNWSITPTLTDGGHNLTVTATDAAGNTSATSSALSVTIDTQEPTISSVTRPNDKTYKIGESLEFTVLINEPVTVTGSAITPPSIDILLDGGKTVKATYQSGSGTNQLVFGYTVQAGDMALTGISIANSNDINLNGKDIIDVSGNSLNPTLGSLVTSGIKVDTRPTVSISSSSGTLVENGGTLTITATLSAAFNQDVSVQLNCTGTAIAGVDYTSSSAIITIPSGSTTGYITLTGIGDSKYEGADESIIVDVINVTNGTESGTQQLNLTIDDNESQPTVTLTESAISLAENGGTANITATLSNKSYQDVTVNLGFTGTATSGIDFTSSGAIITIPSGSTTGSITLTSLNDSIDEYDETITADITGVTNGTESGTQQATVTIIDNDAEPSIYISGDAVDEGDSGTGNLTFTVTLSAISAKTVTVDYETSDGTAKTANSDYIPQGTTTLTFLPGTTCQSIDVVVNGDSTKEGQETVLMNLSNASNAAIAVASAAGIILEDDIPALSISGAAITEGDSGTTSLNFTVILSKPSMTPIDVTYATANNTAIAGVDYVATSGSITFNAGVTSQAITVQVIGDSINESDKTFYVNLSNSSGSTPINDSQAIGTIIDNDAEPTVSINNVTTIEGNSGTTNAAFTVSLSQESGKQVTVAYTTSNGTAAGSDFVAKSGIITFAPGVTSQAITIQVKGDSIDEDDETYSVNLSTATNASITVGSGAGTITDDDAAPSLSISGSSVNEGNSGTANLVYTVTLSAISGKTVTVNYETADGTATSGSDYNLNSGTLTFTAGVTSQSITVILNGDTTQETAETVYVNLSNPINALTTVAQATGTINNDDGPTIRVLGNSVAIANGDTTPSTSDHTDFGSVVNGSTLERTFTITNSGYDPLLLTGAVPYVTISGISAGEFTLTASPSAISIASGSTVTFKITFKPTSAGVKTATVTIANNDVNNSSYTFDIKGTGTTQVSAPTTTTTTTQPTVVNGNVIVIVNGQEQQAATSQTQTVNGQQVTTVTVDDQAVSAKLNSGSGENTVIIPVNKDSDVVVGALNGQTIKNMEQKDAVLEIRTGNVSYTLPASEINIDDVSQQIGEQVQLKDIKVSIKIAEASGETAKIVQNSAAQQSYTVVVKPVDFEITCTSGNKTVDVSKFNGYVERAVAIPDGIDPSKITTGVVLNKDGTFSHVPTHVEKINGKYFAIINSVTNSIYTVIWNPKEFKDVKNHWAKEYVNEVGSRLIDNGVGNDNFAPDRNITRAEFASMIVKALGLRSGNFSINFSDVKKSDSYYDVINIAYNYGIIAGCNDGTFKPNNAITREEAMVMLYKAMKIAKTNVNGKSLADYEKSLTGKDIDSILNTFKDTKGTSSWAKKAAAIVVKGDIFGGNKGLLTPKNKLTRAETATIIINLLKKSELI